MRRESSTVVVLVGEVDEGLLAGLGRSGRLARAAGLLDTLRSLEHGPWWPPLDELIDAARRFYAGGLAETQPAPA
jgi:hypothetical protein